MRITRWSLALASAVVAGSLASGCERQGPMERAGERVDETMDEAGEAVDPSGPAEDAGERLDEATEPD